MNHHESPWAHPRGTLRADMEYLWKELNVALAPTTQDLSDLAAMARNTHLEIQALLAMSKENSDCRKLMDKERSDDNGSDDKRLDNIGSDNNVQDNNGL